MLNISYSCFARKIVSEVPHLACYVPLSIVIIRSYLNSNMTIQTCLGSAVKCLGHFSSSSWYIMYSTQSTGI